MMVSPKRTISALEEEIETLNAVIPLIEAKSISPSGSKSVVMHFTGPQPARADTEPVQYGKIRLVGIDDEDKEFIDALVEPLRVLKTRLEQKLYECRKEENSTST